jgi:hypothetical protein
VNTGPEHLHTERRPDWCLIHQLIDASSVGEGGDMVPRRGIYFVDAVIVRTPCFQNVDIAQLGERYNRTVEVEGSIPPASTLSTQDSNFRLVHHFEWHRAVGSIWTCPCDWWL